MRRTLIDGGSTGGGTTRIFCECWRLGRGEIETFFFYFIFFVGLIWERKGAARQKAATAS